MKKIGILLLIIAVWHSTGAAKSSIYLAPNGLDSNPVTKGKPPASLTGASDSIREFDTEEAKQTQISFKSLLVEMIDREQMARYPVRNYKLMQQSSYNRESVSPSEPEGWFANGDNRQFIRKESNGNRTEWVLMEHEGPGVMTRVWMPDQRIRPVPKKQKQGTLRIYLDGNPDPVIEGEPCDLFNGTYFAGYPWGHQSLSSAVSYLPIPWSKSC